MTTAAVESTKEESKEVEEEKQSQDTSTKDEEMTEATAEPAKPLE